MGPVADDNGTNKQYRDANTANLALEKGEKDFSLSQESFSLTRKVVFLPRIYFACPGYIAPDLKRLPFAELEADMQPWKGFIGWE